MIDAMSVASVAPLSVQDQRRENPVAWRVPSPSRLSLNLSRSRFARAPAESQLSLSLSLSRYSGRTIVRRRLNKESPRLRLQPRILTHYTNVWWVKAKYSPLTTESVLPRSKSKSNEMFYVTSFKNDFMWITKFFISFAIFEILCACFGSNAFYRDYSREISYENNFVLGYTL